MFQLEIVPVKSTLSYNLMKLKEHIGHASQMVYERVVRFLMRKVESCFLMTLML